MPMRCSWAPSKPYTAGVIRGLAKCKIISRVGIGYNNIDVKEATRQGIPVAVVLDASVHEVSDHAMAFVLAFSRRLFPLVQAVRRGVWKTGSTEIFGVRGKMFRLNEQTLGLVGVGRIGSRMAPKARAFGMRVLGYDPYLSARDLEERGAEKVDFDRLLGESDYVSIHAPLTAETEKMFGLKEFRKMKPSAVIINTARGGLMDEAALHQALLEGVIAGAGLDVCEPEPPLAGESPLADGTSPVHRPFRFFFGILDGRTAAKSRRGRDPGPAGGVATGAGQPGSEGAEKSTH